MEAESKELVLKTWHQQSLPASFKTLEQGLRPDMFLYFQLLRALLGLLFVIILLEIPIFFENAHGEELPVANVELATNCTTNDVSASDWWYRISIGPHRSNITPLRLGLSITIGFSLWIFAIISYGFVLHKDVNCSLDSLQWAGHVRERTIWVRGLTPDATVASVRSHFAEFGAITSVSLSLNIRDCVIAARACRGLAEKLAVAKCTEKRASKLGKMEDEFRERREGLGRLLKIPRVCTSHAFVTFEQASSVERCRTKNDQIFFGSKLKFYDAPPPGEVKWENLEVTWSRWLIRNLAAESSSWTIIGLSLVALYFLNIVTNSCASTYLTLFANLILLLCFLSVFALVPLTASLEPSLLSSTSEFALTLRFSLFQFLASTLVPLLVFGIFSVTGPVIFNGMLLDNLMGNIVFELLVPSIVVWRFFHRKGDVLAQDVSVPESDEKSRAVSLLRRHPAIKMAFRFQMVFKPLLLASIFGAAFPITFPVAFLHYAVALAVDNRMHVRFYAPFSPLENLRRGGSVSVSRALAGTLLFTPSLLYFGSTQVVFLRNTTRDTYSPVALSVCICIVGLTTTLISFCELGRLMFGMKVPYDRFFRTKLSLVRSPSIEMSSMGSPDRPSALLYYSHPQLLLESTVDEIIEAAPDSEIGTLVQPKD